MGKFFYKFFLIIFITIISAVIYLSFFGIETDRFDGLIKSKANEVNQNIKLEFNKTKIHLNLKELNLAVKLQNPVILIKNNEINLSKIDLFLALKSFITSDFLLQRAEIAFFKNDIKDLTKITNIFVPRIINKQIKKIFSKGEIQGKFVVPFNSDGSVAENYEINAKIIDADININNDLKINNLSSDIKYVFKSDNNKEINFLINQGKILKLDLQKSSININLIGGKKIIKSKIKTRGNSKYPEIKVISSLLGLDLSNIKNAELTSNLETSIQIWINEGFKIADKAFSVEGKINDFSLEHKEVKSIKNFLPSYNSKIVLKDSELDFRSGNFLNLSGLIKFDKDFNNFRIRGSTDKNFNLYGNINLNDLSVKIPNLNYFKEKNTQANIDFQFDSSKSNYSLVGLKYSSEKSKIEADFIKLNKKFEIEDIKNIDKHKTLKNTIFIKGNLFDAEPLLKSLYKTDDKKIFSKDFNSELKVNFDKAITGTNDDVSEFSMIASIIKGSYNKLSLKGNFSQNEIIEMSIYQIDKNKRTLQVIQIGQSLL